MGWKSIKEKYRIEHTVAVYKDKGICIGSEYIHDIITIGFKGKLIKVWNDVGTRSELQRIITELTADEQTGELKRLVDKVDIFGELFPVYTYENGRVFLKWCEHYRWPNVTTDGYIMYENTYFKDEKEAIKACRESAKAGIKAYFGYFKEMIRDNYRNFTGMTGRLLEHLYYYFLSLFS